MAVWGGRFVTSLDRDAAAFSRSFYVDKRLYRFDILTNLAHAKALLKAGIYTTEEYTQVEACLTQLQETFHILSSSQEFQDEDIHSCIERLVTEKCGEIGKKLHTGKSRNDQVITDTRLYLKEEISVIIALLDSVLKRCLELAESHLDVILPGFTHFQPAQPVLLAHHVMAYFEKFLRDRQRFLDNFESTNVCPLGSGALAGNNYDLNRLEIAKELGFKEPTRNSMDAVSDRDFMLEFCSSAAICMSHLAQWCEELVLWSSPVIEFVEIGDAFTTGSSIMPQKKNPDIAELIRGKYGRILGHVTGMHMVLKGLPLTYNRDLQEDKEKVFDTVDTLNASLTCFLKMLSSLKFNRESIQKSLEKGYVLATEIADYLVQKGIAFRVAHEITGKIVLYAIEKQKALEELQQEEFHQFSEVVDQDIYSWLNVENAVNRKSVYGGTAREQVQYQIQNAKEAFL